MLWLDVLREPVVALPGVEESATGEARVFTVAGVAFVVVDRTGSTAVLAVDEFEAGALVAGNQDLYEEVWSDADFVGIRVDLARTPAPRMRELVVAAWRNKAPDELVPRPRGSR